MGLWKEHFHWSVLLNWVVLAVTVPTILAIAGLLLIFDQYKGAEVCFIITSLFIFAKIVHVAVVSSDGVVSRVVFTFLFFGVVGVAIVETVKGVENWRAAKEKVAVQPTPLTASEPLSIQVQASILYTGTDLITPRLWAKYRSPARGSDVISPISMVFFVVTNNDSKPLAVDNYLASINRQDRGWSNFIPVPAHVVQVFWTIDDPNVRAVAANLAKARMLDIQELPIAEPLPPGKSVSGWLVFDVQMRSEMVPGTSHQLKMEITTTDEKRTVYVTPWRVIGSLFDPIAPTSAGNPHPAVIDIAPGFYDLSGVPKMLYNNTIPISPR